jgi:shikimate kinase / 3-dehydroquinate synthase
MTADLLRAPLLPPGRPRLVVTGFMGTGKTHAGRRAGAILGMPFVDLDDVVARRSGTSIEELIRSQGEPAFRRLERRAILDAARLSGTVVATGGGAVLQGEAFGVLGRGSVTAVLSGDPGELVRRVGDGSSRPLLEGRPSQRIAELLEERGSAYAAAGRRVETDGRSVEEVASELVDLYREAGADGPEDGVEIDIRRADFASRIVVGDGALASLGARLEALVPEATSAVIMLDRAVERSIGPVLETSIKEAGMATSVVPIEGGEPAKTIDVVASFWERFREGGIDRDAVVVAVGGGAVLDVAGFAAATYARGLDLVNVPTTLLAMVDAGIGGKVAIDHAGTKNLVGAFHHPRMTVMDPGVLRSLPPPLVRFGLAEAIKAAVVGSPLVVDVLERADLDENGLPQDLGWIVEQSVRIKAAFVAEDPRDHSVRKALNLGHTFAHAIEAGTGYRIPHGAAVAIGLVAAARLGTESGITPEGTAERLSRLLSRFALPTALPGGLSPDDLLGAMRGDKKRSGGRPVFVVPDPDGARLLRNVDARRAAETLLALEVSSHA